MRSIYHFRAGQHLSSFCLGISHHASPWAALLPSMWADIARCYPAPGRGLGLSLENWIHLLKTLTQARKCLRGAKAQLELIKAASVQRSRCMLRDNLGGPCPALVAAVLRQFLPMVWGWDSDHQSCLVLEASYLFCELPNTPPIHTFVSK